MQRDMECQAMFPECDSLNTTQAILPHIESKHVFIVRSQRKKVRNSNLSGEEEDLVIETTI